MENKQKKIKKGFWTFWVIAVFMTTPHLLAIDTGEKFHSNYPTLNGREINPSLYVRYIKPQLKAMVKDYYSLIKSMAPFYEDIYPVHENLNELLGYYSDLILEIKYKKDLAKIEFLQTKVLASLMRLENLIFEIVDLDDFLIKRGKRYLIQRYFFIYSHIVEISQKLTHLSHMILDAWIVGLDDNLFKKSSWDNIDRDLWEVSLLFERVIYLSLDQDYENNFLMVWSDFFRLIEKQILPNDDIKILSIHLGNMNFSWNNFHKEMSKGGKLKESRDVVSLGTIHNRWNSILKLILN